MRRRTLGETLRLILLTTPLLRATGCGFGHTGGGSGSCYTEQPRNPADYQGLFDGGGTCEEICIGGSGYVIPDGGCDLALLPDGGALCTYEIPCVGGRRPGSLLPGRLLQQASPVGSYFAQAARLEAASVSAFQILARELAEHGAPEHFIRAAHRSASDEIRHAETTGALARRYGAEPIAPRLAAAPSKRSLEEIALENAVEGCAREAYGALVAHWQSRHAADPAVAAAMIPIAAEETRHAELAWALADWAEPRLSPSARKGIAAARARAFADLATEAAQAVDSPVVAVAGLPDPGAAATLLNGLVTSIRGA